MASVNNSTTIYASFANDQLMDNARFPEIRKALAMSLKHIQRELPFPAAPPYQGICIIFDSRQSAQDVLNQWALKKPPFIANVSWDRPKVCHPTL